MNTYPKPEHGSVEWLTLRHHDEQGRTRFGASDAPTLMGVNPYATLIDLALTRWAPAEASEPNPAMVRGNVLEPALVAHAATLLGCPVTTPEVMWSAGRLIATLDGITEDGSAIVEAKTTTAHSSDDQIPSSYYWQAVAQLCCVPDADRVLFIVLDKRMRLGTWEVRRDDDACARLHARADEIGAAFDEHRLPPEIELNEAAVRAIWPEPEGSVEIGATGAALIAEWQAAKAAVSLAEDRERGARDRLAALLAGADTGTVDGHPVVTFRARAGSMRLDGKALERDYPEIVAGYRVQGASFRVLRAK